MTHINDLSISLCNLMLYEYGKIVYLILQCTHKPNKKKQSRIEHPNVVKVLMYTFFFVPLNTVLIAQSLATIFIPMLRVKCFFMSEFGSSVLNEIFKHKIYTLYSIANR